MFPRPPVSIGCSSSAEANARRHWFIAVDASGLDTAGYAIILPMAGGETGFRCLLWHPAVYRTGFAGGNSGLIILRKALSSGCRRLPARRPPDLHHRRRPKPLLWTWCWAAPVYDAIHEAYRNGATIAGTSAGAVMSRQMITGNEYKHP